jgi:hypothetical protein
MAKSTEETFKEALDQGPAGVPSGYVSVELSSRGQLGAPKVFHVRNFGVEELVALSLSDPVERQIKICEALQDMIWEKDVKVSNFHEKEVVELLVFIYYTFYGQSFQNLEYDPTEEDWDYLAKQFGGKDAEEYTRARQQFSAGQWKPKFDIDLDKSVKYLELPDDFKSTALVTKQSGFSCKYSFPRYGDVVLTREVVNRVWKKEDSKYRSIAEILRFRRDSEERIRKGETINYRSIPNVTQADYDDYYDYEKRKANFIVQVVKALHLVEYRGRDVSQESIDARIALAKDPEIDGVTFEQIQKHFDEMQVGIDPMVKVFSPIQEREVDRRFPFRVDTVLQCLRDAKPAGTVVQFV